MTKILLVFVWQLFFKLCKLRIFFVWNRISVSFSYVQAHSLQNETSFRMKSHSLLVTWQNMCFFPILNEIDFLLPGDNLPGTCWIFVQKMRKCEMKMWGIFFKMKMWYCIFLFYCYTLSYLKLLETYWEILFLVTVIM